MERIHQLDGEREELAPISTRSLRPNRKMLAQALQAGEDYLQAAKAAMDMAALVVRNGYATEREVLLGARSVQVGHRGSTTEGWMTMATGGASRA